MCVWGVCSGGELSVTVYSAGRIFPDFRHDFLSHFWPNKNGVNKNEKKNGTHDGEVELNRMRGLLLKTDELLIFARGGSCDARATEQRRKCQIPFSSLDSAVDLVT